MNYFLETFPIIYLFSYKRSWEFTIKENGWKLKNNWKLTKLWE